MSRYAFKLPDLAEGTVEAELVSWQVAPGDVVQEGQVIAEMATEKAVVELPAPVAGRVLEIAGKPGDFLAVGSVVAVFETDADAPADIQAAAPTSPAAAAVATPDGARAVAAPSPAVTTTAASTVLAAPATRRRAAEAGIDLASLIGSGPDGRIEAADLDAAINAQRAGKPAATKLTGAASQGTALGDYDELRIIGVRRVIAERTAMAASTIPHFTYVEEIDVTALEALRRRDLARYEGVKPTPLAYLIAALTRVLPGFPNCNARYDAARETLLRYRPVHVGIATQTPDGLKVPVVRHAERLDVPELARAIERVSASARDNSLGRDQLGGSTITVTSLGKLGGIVTTPVINLPETAIIGVNRIVERPVVRDGQVIVRQMMNLSSSFDHRFVDGYDAAALIQALKAALELPDPADASI
jgi:2-oxoisovalerate dehydrogenase E2 component (dihydrolipoyl transacylase)